MFEYVYDMVSEKPVIKEFDIADGTAVALGELVRITEGKVVAGSTDYTTPYAGVTAEAKAANDGKLRIKLYCSPFAVFAVAPIRTTVTETPSATVWTDSTTLLNTTADKGNGGYLVIKGKGTGATGTFAVGDKKAISDSATNTLTSTFAGNTTVGDYADFYPPVGNTGVTASADNARTLTWAATSGTALEVVDHDFTREKVHVMVKLHQFSN
jgi:hypothetical protein